MNDERMLQIARLCLRLEETAVTVYRKLFAQAPTVELAAFWEDMVQDESAHVDFWRRVVQTGEKSGLPDQFEDKDQVLRELGMALLRAEDLIRRCDDECTVSGAFLLAYRVEVGMLNPAMAVLLNVLASMADGESPEVQYTAHIEKFVDGLVRHSGVTPELELLGETLRGLWRENRTMAKLATRDDLTGVLNRRGFLGIAAQLSFLAQRNEKTVAILMIDLDRFTALNGRFGHEVGDDLLRGVAQTLTRTLRTSDIVARWGGDEFVVLLPTLAPGSSVLVANKLRQAMKFQTPDGAQVTVSIGAAESAVRAAPRETLDSLIRQAETTLQRARATGGNQVAGPASDGNEPDRC
jgi:diguanylate cyclase (GGDEF)-like protein